MQDYKDKMKEIQYCGKKSPVMKLICDGEHWICPECEEKNKMKKEIKYAFVRKEYKKETELQTENRQIKPLSEKVVFNPNGLNWIWDKNVKKATQNLKNYLKDSADLNLSEEQEKIIDKAFEKYYGEMK